MHAHRNTQRRAQKPPYYCCRHAWELWHKRQTNSMTHPLSHQEESCLAKWKPSNQLICLWAFENTCFWCHRQYLHCLFSHFCSIFFMMFQQLCHNWTASVLSEVMNKYKLYARLCVFLSLCGYVGLCVRDQISKQAATKSNWLLWSPKLSNSFKLSVCLLDLPTIGIPSSLSSCFAANLNMLRGLTNITKLSYI